MAAVHPPPEKIAALRRRWEGQEKRLHAIARSILAGEDWTVHLVGLAYVDEVPPLPGEAHGRDLRGARLDRFLQPDVDLYEAEEKDAALVAGVTLEGLRNNTPLPDVSPFPADVEGAEQVALAMRRGEHFVLARAAQRIVGVVRWAERREFRDLTVNRPYAEISGLAVLPPWRRQGIGERLLREAEQSAVRRAHDHALLRTTYELGLVGWYERLGYVACFTRQMTYRDAPTFLDVVMVRRIASSPAAAPPAGTRVRSRACLEAPLGTPERAPETPPANGVAHAQAAIESAPRDAVVPVGAMLAPSRAVHAAAPRPRFYAEARAVLDRTFAWAERATG